LEAALTSRVHARLRSSRQWLPRRGCRRRVASRWAFLHR